MTLAQSRVVDAPGPPLIIRYGSRDLPIGRPPSARQRIFLNAGEKEQLYGGAKSGGKSFAICSKLIMLAVAIPGNRLGLFRKDLTDLRDSTLVTLLKLLPPELIIGHHKTHRIIRIRTSREPSELIYGGLGDQHEVESAKGKEFGAFAVDEPSEIELETYLQLLAQLRWVLPDGSFPPYQAFMGSNPEPGWVEERFRPLINATSDTVPTVVQGDLRFIRALPRDNPYLPPNWEEELRNKAPAIWVEKYLNGSWDVSEGQVFKEFDRRTHCIDLPPLEYLRTLKLVGALDHGSTGVTAFTLTGFDPEGNAIALDEYYERDRLVSAHATGIKVLLQKWAGLCGRASLGIINKTAMSPDQSVGICDYILIDPSTQAKTQQNKVEMWSIQEEYQRNGIPTTLAWNALETGINLIAEYFHINGQHVHPFIHIDRKPLFGSPRLFYVTRNVPNLIRETISLKRDITERGAIRYIGSDHALDGIRYTLMSRPDPPARSQGDLLARDSITQQVNRTHDKWAAGFGKPKKPDNCWF